MHTYSPGTRSAAYAMYGNAAAPSQIPPAFQVETPFGADVGGVNPAFFGIRPDARYDSWLTAGIDDGDVRNSLSSIGLDFDTWNEVSGITADDGAVYSWILSTARTVHRLTPGADTGQKASHNRVFILECALANCNDGQGLLCRGGSSKASDEDCRPTCSQCHARCKCVCKHGFSEWRSGRQ